MKSSSTIFALCYLGVLSMLASCRVHSTAIAPPEPGYTLVWSDEFDVDGPPNPANWNYETGFVRNNELQWYQPENATVKNGVLLLTGRRDTIANPNFDPASADWRKNRENAFFTSACVRAKGLHQWAYGIFEIRAKIQTEEGLWPAIWTLGDGHEWPSGGEIDLMEYYDDQILANAAWAGKERYQAIWDSSKKPLASFEDPNWSDQFHIWRMVWTPTSIDLFLDDELLNSIPLDQTINQRGTVENPFRETKHYLLLNLAIGGNAGGDPAKATFPARYEIDYVRVFQK